MKIKELKEIRVTQLSSARDCEYKLLYQLTKPEPIKNVNLFCGFVFHSCLEKYFKHRVGNVEDMQWFELGKIFTEIFEEESKDVDFSKMSKETAKFTALHYLNIYFRERCKFLYPGKVDDEYIIEKRYYMKAKMGDESLVITGKIDLLTISMVVIDHKTTGSLAYWTQEKADRSWQAQLYQKLCLVNGIDVKGFQFNIVSQKGMKVIDVTYNPVMVQEILKYAFELQKTLESNMENLRYSSSKFICNCCSWKEECSKRRT